MFRSVNDEIDMDDVEIHDILPPMQTDAFSSDDYQSEDQHSSYQVSSISFVLSDTNTLI